MNPTPRKGQRWLWEFNLRNINSLCVAEVIERDSHWIKFKYVQIIRTNWRERMGTEFGLSEDNMNNECDFGKFTYLEGQDNPQ